jgi:hypothetical protein
MKLRKFGHESRKKLFEQLGYFLYPVDGKRPTIRTLPAKNVFFRIICEDAFLPYFCTSLLVSVPNA